MDDLLARQTGLAALRDAIRAAAQLLCDVCAAGGKLLVCGNGSSAADSEHLVGELMKAFVRPRPLLADDRQKLRVAVGEDWQEVADGLQRGFPALALTGHPALASAIANDTDPAMVFAQQVYVLGRTGDALIAFSTSGKARNVLRAAQVARAFGLRTVGFTGAAPSPLAAL